MASPTRIDPGMWTVGSALFFVVALAIVGGSVALDVSGRAVRADEATRVVSPRGSVQYVNDYEVGGRDYSIVDSGRPPRIAVVEYLPASPDIARLRGSEGRTFLMAGIVASFGFVCAMGARQARREDLERT